LTEEKNYDYGSQMERKKTCSRAYMDNKTGYACIMWHCGAIVGSRRAKSITYPESVIL